VPVIYYDTAYIRNKDLTYTKVTAKSDVFKDVPYIQMEVDDYLDSYAYDYAGGWDYN